jgi:hypothetical protein
MSVNRNVTVPDGSSVTLTPCPTAPDGVVNQANGTTVTRGPEARVLLGMRS